MAQFSKFGIEVKKRLLETGHNQQWLVENVREKTGLYVDSPYISNVLLGNRSPAKIITAICEILDIPTPPDC